MNIEVDLTNLSSSTGRESMIIKSHIARPIKINGHVDILEFHGVSTARSHQDCFGSSSFLEHHKTTKTLPVWKRFMDKGGPHSLTLQKFTQVLGPSRSVNKDNRLPSQAEVIFNIKLKILLISTQIRLKGYLSKLQNPQKLDQALNIIIWWWSPHIIVNQLNYCEILSFVHSTLAQLR